MNYDDVEVATIDNQYMIVYPKELGKKSTLEMGVIFKNFFPSLKSKTKSIRTGCIPVNMLSSFTRVKSNNWENDKIIAFSSER